MATIHNLEGKGMGRMASNNPQQGQKAQQGFASVAPQQQTQMLDDCISTLDDCCDKCQKAGLTDCFDQCDDMRTQLHSTKRGVTSGAAMATDWFALLQQAFAVIKMIADLISKQNPSPSPNPNPTVQGSKP